MLLPRHHSSCGPGERKRAPGLWQVKGPPPPTSPRRSPQTERAHGHLKVTAVVLHLMYVYGYFWLLIILNFSFFLIGIVFLCLFCHFNSFHWALWLLKHQCYMLCKYSNYIFRGMDLICLTMFWNSTFINEVLCIPPLLNSYIETDVAALSSVEILTYVFIIITL